MNKIIKVGMADLQVTMSPNTLRTCGLGSCVGIVLYDQLLKQAGMAHIMLPDSSMARNNVINRAKYADTAIADCIKELTRRGASSFRLKAKIAGGAQMFQFSAANEAMRIGPRNINAVRECLLEERIPIVYEDTGGRSGRTIEFNPGTAVLEIRTVNKGIVHV